jgi:hypothetical protein
MQAGERDARQGARRGQADDKTEHRGTTAHEACSAGPRSVL